MNRKLQTARSLLLDEEEASEDVPGIRVNEKFAKRFEHNKRREELHRLQEKHIELAERLQGKAARVAAAEDERDEDETTSSSSEDESDEELEDDMDKVLQALVRIKSQDPSIYEPTMRLFPDDEGELPGKAGAATGGVQPHKAQRKAKAITLREVLAKQALEQGGDGASSSDEEMGVGMQEDEAGMQLKSYTQEQNELKRAFLRAAEEAQPGAEGGDSEAFGSVLRKRARTGTDEQGARGGAVPELLSSYFGDDAKLDANDRFLKNFIASRAWMVDSGAAVVSESDEENSSDDGGAVADAAVHQREGGEDDEEVPDVDEDKDFLTEVDRFEAAYNFRFEEPGGARILTHPRMIQDTLRKTDDRRKRKRQEKAERRAAEEEERRAEVKRLKNLKRREIEGRVSQVHKVAGAAAPPEALMEQLLQGDFDPDDYDRRMAAAFNDDYYDAEVEEGEDEQEALLAEAAALEALAAGEGAADDEHEEGDGGGFAAVRRRLQAQMASSADAAAAAAQRASLSALLEEYYKLDYEDMVAGVPCRFKYKEVAKESFGLSDEDILRHSDKELNLVAGLKLLAPYRDEHHKARPNYKALQQLKGQTARSGGGGRSSSGGRGGGQGGGAGEQGQRKEWHAKWKGKGGEQGRSKDSGHQQQQEGADDVADQKGQQQQQGKKRLTPAEGGSGADGGAAPAAAAPAGGDPEGQAQRRLEARKQSYAKLTLKKDGRQGSGRGDDKHAGEVPGQQQRKKQKLAGSSSTPQSLSQQQQQQRQQQQSEEYGKPQLTKAQKKNLKRCLKRAAHRTAANTNQNAAVSS